MNFFDEGLNTEEDPTEKGTDLSKSPWLILHPISLLNIAVLNFYQASV